MVDEDVLAIEGREDVDVAVLVSHDFRGRGRLEHGVLQLGPIKPDKRPQIGEAERSPESMHVPLGQL